MENKELTKDNLKRLIDFLENLRDINEYLIKDKMEVKKHDPY